MQRHDFTLPDTADVFVVFTGHESQPFWERSDGPEFCPADALTYEQALQMADDGVFDVETRPARDGELEQFLKAAMARG